MSYEGFEEHICAKGHQFDTSPSAWFDDYDAPKCPYCFSPTKFCNSVDQTNGPSQGEIDEEGWKSILITPEVSQKCNLGHFHVLSQAVYRIPTKEEMEQYRMYFDEETGDLLTNEDPK